MSAVLKASDWLNGQLSNSIPARPSRSAWNTKYALVGIKQTLKPYVRQLEAIPRNGRCTKLGRHKLCLLYI